jgi:hypothetical protein
MVAHQVQCPKRPLVLGSEIMHGESVDDRCHWEELLLGRPYTLRKGVTIPILVLLGGWAAYVQFDHPTGPREDRVENSATLLSDVAVPEPLWKEAEKQAAGRVFRDYACYREFLEREQLLEGVLIIRAYSENGGLLYHAFPPLDDRNTFSNLIALLPDLASVRAHSEPPFDRTRVCSFPAKQLASRPAAERLFSTDCFPPTNPLEP